MRKTGAITLDVKPSLLGQAVVTLLAGVALAVAFYVQPPLLVFLVVAIAVGLLWAWRIAAFNKPRWRRVVVATHGDQIVLSGKGKQRVSGHLAKRKLDSGMLVGFSVNSDEGQHSVWLFADNVPSEQFGELRDQLNRLSKG